MCACMYICMYVGKKQKVFKKGRDGSQVIVVRGRYKWQKSKENTNVAVQSGLIDSSGRS